MGALTRPSHASAAEPEEARVHSRMPLVLWIASAAFIVYGTTIPFQFIADPQVVREHLARVTLNPFIAPDTGGRVSIPDFTANVLLFLPFGAFGVWALGRWRNVVVRVGAVVITGFLLSATVEILQLFTTDRVTAVSDTFANTVGTLGGAVAATILTASARQLVVTAATAGLTDSAALFPLIVAVLLMLAGAWEPFDVTLDVGSIASKLRFFLADPLQFKALSDEGVSMLQHLLFTSTLVLWLRDIGVRRAAALAAVVGVVVAVCAEAGQLFIGARMPGVLDAAVGAGGAVAGVLVGIAFSNAPRPRPRLWCGALIALTAIGAGMQQLSPFHRVADPRPFQWTPFLNYYEFTTSETVSHAAELLLAYFPLGFGVAFVIAGRRSVPVAVILIALSVAAPIEYLQRFIGGRFPDVTDIAISVGGACAGAWVATGGARLFADEIAIVLRSVHAAADGWSST